jgi:membrane protease YdiL (CAAX protease family)
VVSIGILEEIIFRGIMNHIALGFPGFIGAIGILFSILLFGASHVFSGGIQFVSKTFLGVIMNILFFVSGSIWVPALAHAVFNFCVLNQYSLKVMKDG